MEINGKNYDFIVVGKKNSDCFVIKDLRDGMGGMCCVSKYTLTQLLPGYSILGVSNPSNESGSLSVKDITPMLMDGTIAEQNMTFPNVKDTKRSAVTVEKGIKLSRTEKAQKNAAVKKRQQTIKENKRVKKAQEAEEQEKKKLIEQKKKKYEKLVKNARKKIMKSKCVIAVSKIEEVCGEYHGDRDYTAEVILSSPAAITAFMKVAHNFTYGTGYSARELNTMLKRQKVVKFTVEINEDRYYFLMDDPNIQLVYAKTVRLSFEQHYDDYAFDATFYSPDFKWSFSGHHCTEESISGGFGTTADGGDTLNGWRHDILKRGYVA